MREDSCLPDQTSLHEDLAETAPLAHDDLGCPIRRDRLYNKDTMGATPKPLSGPPVSPSLFRSPRSSAAERPSPKAIQASIKESATLAAAISMQWKEEVSAMRRELAELRRDLCKELRAFNCNFNTFTQHYNTWSPQGGNVAAGPGIGLSGGMRAGAGMDARTKVGGDAGVGAEAGAAGGPEVEVGVRGGAGLGVGTEAVGLGTSPSDFGNEGVREKKPHLSKVSVGTQARSKVLVRQSTADAAVNCPEEKEEKKGSKRNLPKQLSMDPSILASPQAMYVESAIPLSLDPILPGSIRAVQPEPFDLTSIAPKAKPKPEVPDQVVVSSSDAVMNKPVTSTDTVPLSSETTPEGVQESETVEQELLVSPELINIHEAEKTLSGAEASQTPHTKSADAESNEKDKLLLPYPVPVVTVSPPEEPDVDTTSDSECPGVIAVDEPDQVSRDSTAVSSLCSEEKDSDSCDAKPSDDEQGVSSSGLYREAVTPTEHSFEDDIRCPSIVVSEYLDKDTPDSPSDSDTSLDPIVTLPDDPPDLPQEQMMSVSTFSSSSLELHTNTDPESQDSEWPPLPEPLDSTPIYHADLVHFDLVMLTSLDQDDLDSVFMDPEPEPFDLSVDSPSNVEDLDPPLYQSDCSSSPIPTIDSPTMCPLDSSQLEESLCLDPVMEYCLAHLPQDAASELDEVRLPQVTVTISPPSSVSPDTSLEMDFSPTSPASDPIPPDADPSQTDPGDSPSLDLAQKEPDVAITETLECMAVSQERAEGGPLGGLERTSSEQAFLWCRWQRRGQRREAVRRSASVELWSRRYEYNSAEITYVSLTL